MRTTVDISDAILRDLREKARLSKRPFRVVMEEALQYGLACTASPPTQQKIHIEPHPVGIKAPYRAMSMNQLYDQIEADSTLKD